jgi:hypothetical protein
MDRRESCQIIVQMLGDAISFDGLVIGVGSLSESSSGKGPA